jgi:hypothetical protein
MDAMPEDASMQEREDKLTVPHLTSERNAEQGSDRKVAQRQRIDPRSVCLLQVIAIVAAPAAPCLICRVEQLFAQSAPER